MVGRVSTVQLVTVSVLRHCIERGRGQLRIADWSVVINNNSGNFGFSSPKLFLLFFA